MNYQILAEDYATIEATSSRLKMTDILVDLIKKTPLKILPKLVYLTQGKLYPDFMGIEIGMAEKLAAKAFLEVTKIKEKELALEIKNSGDLGQAAFNLMKKINWKSKEKLTAEEVYSTLDKIARTSGVGTVGKRIEFLSLLLKKASPLEAKYLLRTVTGKLRLGLADMTILDALSIVYGGGKHSREILERAYNLSSDLGDVARRVAEGGLKAVEKAKVQVKKPIRPMLAERLSSPKEILEKIGGRCAVEFKYDGERLQIHKKDNEIVIFSRRLENITFQYPDVTEMIRKYIKAKEIILEAEVVAFNPETGEMLPFQELMHRRRKYGIKEAVEEYPVTLFVFDCLYKDGEDLTHTDYQKRRQIVDEIIKPDEKVKPGIYIITSNPKELEDFFEEAISEGVEGVICKAVGKDAIYRAGARGWLWIKYKRDYKSEMTDTVDLVVVGGFYGRGKRGGLYGALLLAVYNPQKDEFLTITKCGSGFTDKDLALLPQKLDSFKIDHPHPRLKINTKFLKPDVYFIPSLVLEIIGAEITLSPTHTCGWEKIKKDAGLAIRFPRFTGKYRQDKASEDATTEQEIIGMYQSQLQRLSK